MARRCETQSPRIKALVTDRGVKRVVLGNILFKTWYHSIYPEELVSKDTDILYVCPWCFRYSTDAISYTSHIRACELQTIPPGNKLYENAGYAVWEVDGDEHRLFAQNLSLFAKLFLDHKSVFFDVTGFVYYILTYTDPKAPNNYHVLGYFSKEKLSWDANNLACILIFPPYQHKQLGKLLMGVSYKLSAWEWEGGFIGGPERPLSEMGRRSYIRFWQERIARYFLLGPPGGDPDEFIQQKQTSSKAAGRNRVKERMTVREIGLATGMLAEDVLTAVKSMDVVQRSPPMGKRRKRSSASSGPGDDNLNELDIHIIRKSRVLEWAQTHKVLLRDPVREQGFLGEWGPENLQTQSSCPEVDEDDN